MKKFHVRINGGDYSYGALNFLAEGSEESRDFARMLFPNLVPYQHYEVAEGWLEADDDHQR